MKKKVVMLILMGIGLTMAGMLFSQQANVLFIRDILDNPQRYYNLQVQIQGEVTEVFNAPNPNTRGYYKLLDNSDKTIKIVANTLPAPNTKLTVSGIVQIETSTQVPYIREVNRFGGSVPIAGGTTGKTTATTTKSEGMDPMIIGLIALIALIVIILLVVVFKKPSTPQQQVTVQPTQPTTPEPVTKAPMKTKQVSIEEVNKQVGGLKTKQVPSLLAELKIMTGDQAGKSFPLSYETSIGRVNGDIILEDSSVSREHAKIVYSGNKYKLENISETNPAILNGTRIKLSKELKDGDEIVLGVIKMKFRLI